MNNWNWLKLGVFVLFLAGMICWSSWVRSEGFYKSMLEDRIEESYSGIVAKKYIDTQEHNIPMLQFTDSSRISIENDFWSKISMNDSIVKKKGSAYICVYRNGKLNEKFDYKKYIDELIEMHVH